MGRYKITLTESTTFPACVISAVGEEKLLEAVTRNKVTQLSGNISMRIKGVATLNSLHALDYEISNLKKHRFASKSLASSLLLGLFKFDYTSDFYKNVLAYCKPFTKT